MLASLPYNHLDPLAMQLPLPVQRRILPENPPRVPRRLEAAAACLPTASGQFIRIRLDTDSAHLASFFRLNWSGEATRPTAAEARILALRGNPEDYGLSSELRDSRWYCPENRQVWILGSEYYGNVKITVRGLCSELAPADDMFLHGCAMDVQGHGLVLCGMSGAGKTTLTAALRRALRDEVRIINDDWGPLSLRSGVLVFTNERRLHMKYASVRLLAPTMRMSPATHHSENFHGDPSDPRARLMIPPEHVFGLEGTLSKSSLSLIAVVVRHGSTRSRLRMLGVEDLPLLEQGEYSRFYRRIEWFMNGSLFLFDDERMERQREGYRTLLRRFPVVMLENEGSADEGARLVLDVMRGVDQHPSSSGQK